MSAHAKGTITLRPADFEDKNRLFEWRNDPDTRLASTHPKEISPESHSAWFTRALGDPAIGLFIVEENGCPVGQVRLDRLEGDLAEVHIAIAAHARGRGIGRETIRLARGNACRALGAEQLVARVKAYNQPSLRAFMANGFEEASRQDDWVELTSHVSRPARPSGRSA